MEVDIKWLVMASVGLDLCAIRQRAVRRICRSKTQFFFQDFDSENPSFLASSSF